MKKYLLNCFLFLLPVMLWDFLFTAKLPAAFQPDVFWQNIPEWLTYGENISRTLVFMMALLMPLPIRKLHEKPGFKLYIAGLTLYFLSWILLIDYPQSLWSHSLWGFMAPAYTPVLWLAGIGLMGKEFYFRIPYKTYYFLIMSLIFVAFHSYHAWLVWSRGV